MPEPAVNTDEDKDTPGSSDADNDLTDALTLPDYLEEVIIQGLEDGDEDTIIIPDSTPDDATPSKTPKTKPTPASDGDVTPLTEDIKTLRTQLDALKTDKTNLQKALHEQRQKLKSIKATPADEDVPLTEAQLVQIYEENKDDPKTLLRIVKHQAEQAAKKASGKAVLDSDIKSKVKEADNLLLTMYPRLTEEGSEIRTATDEIKSFYNIDDNPFGDFFAMGVQVLNALPNIIASAEKRGEDKALNIKADDSRKKDIKTNQTTHTKSTSPSNVGLSKTEQETAKQLNLSPGAFKTYQKLVGNKQSKNVQVKE